MRDDSKPTDQTERGVIKLGGPSGGLAGFIAEVRGTLWAGEWTDDGTSVLMDRESRMEGNDGEKERDDGHRMST